MTAPPKDASASESVRDPCPDPDQVRDFLEDRLGAEACRHVGRHIDHCASCQQIAEDLTSRSRWALAFAGDALSPKVDSTTPAVGPVAEAEFVRIRRRRWTLPSEGENFADLGNQAIPSFCSVGKRFSNLQPLGRGAGAVVYRAVDTALERVVAIKVPHAALLADPQARRRFLVEMRAASMLHHPNIVAVYDAVLDDYNAYIVFEHISGTTLARWLEVQPKPADSRTAALIVADLARGVQHAHEQGILHRDLKPSNVLLDEGSHRAELPFVPRISDFGIARFLDGDATCTSAEQVIGSPSFMAPERVKGDAGRLAPASDVYSLGAILYQLITLRLPVEGTAPTDVLRRVLTEVPISPRRHQREIPRDLESICLKCLEKRPEDRYASAGQLADDLELFLMGQPTLARPISRVTQGLRWVRRHPSRSAAVLTSFVAAVLVVAIGTWSLAVVSSAQRETSLKQQALEAEQQALHAEQEKNRLHELTLLGARIRERSLNRPRGWVSENLADIRQAVPESADEEMRYMLRGEAVRALCAVEMTQAETILESFDTFGVAYSPDGRILAVGDNGPADTGRVLLFDADTLQEIRRLTFDSPSHSQQYTVGREGVRSFQFTPDGKRLFVGTRTGMIHVWDVVSGAHERQWHAHQGDTAWVLSLGLMPEHGVLVSLSDEPQLRFWTFESGECLATIPLARVGEDPLVVVGDSVFLVADDRLFEFRYEPDTRTVRTGRSSVPLKPRTPQQLSLLPDGKTVLGLGRDMDALISFDLSGASLRHQSIGRQNAAVHDGNIHQLQASADGRWLLSTAPDGLKLWDLVSREVVGAISNSANRRVSAAFHPHRAEIVLASDEGLRRWRISGSAVWDSEMRQSDPVMYMDLSPCGSRLAGAISLPRGPDDKSAKFRICTVETGGRSQMKDWSADVFNAPPMAFSNDGRFLACGYRPDPERDVCTIRLIDVPGRSQLPPLAAIRYRIGKPAFAASDDRLWYCGNVTGASSSERIGFVGASRSGDGRDEFLWLNERSERELQRSGFLAIVVGERVVAASSIDNTIRLFDSDSGNLLREVPVPGQIVDSLCLSGDEQWLLCGTRQGEMFAISTNDGRIGFRETVHAEAIRAACGAVNGLVFTACRDGTLASWQFSDGRIRKLFRLGPLGRRISDAVLSRDGTLLAVLVEGETGIRVLRVRGLREQLVRLGLDWKN